MTFQVPLEVGRYTQSIPPSAGFSKSLQHKTPNRFYRSLPTSAKQFYASSTSLLRVRFTRKIEILSSLLLMQKISTRFLKEILRQVTELSFLRQSFENTSNAWLYRIPKHQGSPLLEKDRWSGH